MAIRVALNHTTTYQFDRAVKATPHVVRLRPAAHARTPIEAYSLKIKPDKHWINWQQDPFGNYLARLVFPEPVSGMSFEVDLIAEMTVINPFDFFVEEYAEDYPFQYDRQLLKELAPYMEITEQGPLLTKWLSKIDRSYTRIVDFLVDLNQRLEKDVEYTIRMEPGIQTCEDTLQRALGSCRDTGWLLVQILRHLGLAARFVSGYLIQLTPDVKPLEGPVGTDHDFTDLHAWAEVYVPGAGWLGLDPTSGLFAGEGHIPLACTPDPVSAAPITGATDTCEVEFSFTNSVKRIHEDPRVTKPYTQEQWTAIEALGRSMDAEFVAQDVRLTMGGEPTFVSIDDMESEQWNNAALGAHKRKLAGNLLRRLWNQFARGGLLHYGQGKWYPGEPLPRWALSCIWRKDGTPVWRDSELIALDDKDYGYDHEDAQAFAEHLSKSIGVNGCYLVPGYEDTFYYLWKEGDQPINIDPLKADLKDSMERRRLASVLATGLDQPTGFALPLRWDEPHERWESCAWEFRRGHMFLVPGDSPMGLRLPLDALPWVAKEEREQQHEQSLFAPLPQLGDFYGEVTRRYSHLVEHRDDHPEITQQESGDDDETEMRDIIHTALCVEAREGVMHVFLPPLTHLEHFLDLVASVELVAEELSMPVRLEGYEPPSDWRVERFAITPDPGVIANRSTRQSLGGS